LTADDIANAGVEIPSITVVKEQLEAQEAVANNDPESLEKMRGVPKGYYKIAGFKHKHVKYTLYETPAVDADSMVNLWTSEDLQDDGELVRGKPFNRYFVVLVDVLSTAAQYAAGPIPFMPMGYNKPFEPAPIMLPIGRTNPYKSNPQNIMDMHKKDDFRFTAGNMAATANADVAFFSDDKPVAIKTESKSTKSSSKKAADEGEAKVKTEKVDKKEKKVKKEKKEKRAQ
jgi:hypothetical protein